MGEAKNRREALKKRLLRECDLMEQPVTPFLQRVEDHARSLIYFQIERDWRARHYGMIPGECHLNSDFAEENDAQGRIKAVRGWWLNGHALLSHSVIRIDGKLVCITPLEGVAPELASTLWFAEDTLIERDQADGKLKIFGEDLPERISMDREQDAALSARLRSKIAAGMDPYALTVNA